MAFIDDIKREIAYIRDNTEEGFCFVGEKRGLLFYSGIATAWTVTAKCIYSFSPNCSLLFVLCKHRYPGILCIFFSLPCGKSFSLFLPAVSSLEPSWH